MVIEGLDRAILSLQVDPDAEEARELQVAAPYGIGEGKANRQRMRHRNREGRMEQGKIRAAFGRENKCVNPVHTPGKEVRHAINRYRHDLHLRKLTVNNLLEIGKVGNSNPQAGSSADPL